jgi:hypothetical protein
MSTVGIAQSYCLVPDKQHTPITINRTVITSQTRGTLKIVAKGDRGGYGDISVGITGCGPGGKQAQRHPERATGLQAPVVETAAPHVYVVSEHSTDRWRRTPPTDTITLVLHPTT